VLQRAAYTGAGERPLRGSLQGSLAAWRNVLKLSKEIYRPNSERGRDLKND